MFVYVCVCVCIKPTYSILKYLLNPPKMPIKPTPPHRRLIYKEAYAAHPLLSDALLQQVSVSQ
jgi:hypothetical protein